VYVIAKRNVSLCVMFIANTCGRELRRKGCRTTERHQFVFRIPHMYIQYCSKYKNPNSACPGISQPYEFYGYSY